MQRGTCSPHTVHWIDCSHIGPLPQGLATVQCSHVGPLPQGLATVQCSHIGPLPQGLATVQCSHIGPLPQGLATVRCLLLLPQGLAVFCDNRGWQCLLPWLAVFLSTGVGGAQIMRNVNSTYKKPFFQSFLAHSFVAILYVLWKIWM